MPETEKKRRADYIINNDGTEKNFYNKIEDFLNQLNI